MTRTPLFIFSADWHMCRSAWVDRGIYGDASFALYQVAQLAAQYRVPIIGAGDLFDSPVPHPADLVEVGVVFRGLVYDLLYNQGNHDKYVSLRGVNSFAVQLAKPWLGIALSAAVHQSRQLVKIGSKLLYFLDYLPPGELSKALLELGGHPQLHEIDYLVAHQAWSELGNKKGEAHGRLIDVPGRMHVLSGDLHATKVVEFAPGRFAYSPGALHRLSIDEPDQHAVFLFYDDGSHEVLPLQSRCAHRVTLRTAEELDSFLADGLTLCYERGLEHFKRMAVPAIPLFDHGNALAKSLLYVKFAAELPDARARLTAAAGEQFHLFLRPMGDTAAAAATTLATGMDEDLTLVDVFADFPLDDLAAECGVLPDVLRGDVLTLLQSPLPASKAVKSLLTTMLAVPAAS